MHIPDKIKITPVSLPGQHFVEGARGRLHSGELEAIVLSQEIDANLVLLDAFAKKHH
jgi:predicted nucleic acid-binding protein